MAISSSEKRNWRGICIALLVISAVLSIIVFSIFLLSPGTQEGRKITFVIALMRVPLPSLFFLLIKIYIFHISISAFLDDFALFIAIAKKYTTVRIKTTLVIEDARIYGRRILLSDIYNDSLKWKRFNGSWINGEISFLPSRWTN